MAQSGAIPAQSSITHQKLRKCLLLRLQRGHPLPAISDEIGVLPTLTNLIEVADLQQVLVPISTTPDPAGSFKGEARLKTTNTFGVEKARSVA